MRRTFVAIAATASLLVAACGSDDQASLDVDEVETCEQLSEVAVASLEESLSDLIADLNELDNTSQIGSEQLDPFNESSAAALDPVNERRQELGCANDFMAGAGCEALDNVRGEVESGVAQEAFDTVIDPLLAC